MRYTHLSQDERDQIRHLNGGGFSAGDIGRELKRAATTTRRELHRNHGDRGKNDARVAQHKSATRRHIASAQPRILPGRWAIVEARLTTDQWSPVQIASEVSISHERIYGPSPPGHYVAADRQRGGALWLQAALPQATAPWPEATQSVWHATSSATLVERKTGLLRMRRVTDGKTDTVMRAVIHALHPLRARVHPLTKDNGSEFAEHALIEIVLNTRSYFAEPH